MITNDIRRVIDANLPHLKLSPEDVIRIRNTAMQSQSPRKHNNLRRITLVMIFTLLIVTLLATALSVPVRSMRSYHEDDNYTMAISNTEDTPVYMQNRTVSDQVRSVWGDDIADFMMENSAFTNLPTWMPEDFKRSDIVLISGEDEQASCTAFYLNSEYRDLILQIDLLDAPEDFTVYYSIHSDGGPSEKWHIDGMEYHFEETEHFCYVVWIENNCMTIISTETGREVLLKMVESITSVE